MKRTLSLLVVAAITTSSVASVDSSWTVSLDELTDGEAYHRPSFTVSGKFGQIDNSSNTASEERTISLGYNPGNLALSGSATTRDGNLQDSQSISGRYDLGGGLSASAGYDTDLAGDAGAATAAAVTYRTPAMPGLTASATVGYTNTECGDTSDMFGDNSFSYVVTKITGITNVAPLSTNSAKTYVGVQLGGMATSLSSTDKQAYGAAAVAVGFTGGLSLSARAQTREVEDGFVKSDAATGSVRISYKFQF